MLATKRTAGVAPEVNLWNPLLHAGEEACKREIYPGFETQGSCYQNSKTGVSVAPQKGLMFSKHLKKKTLSLFLCLSTNFELNGIHFIMCEQNLRAMKYHHIA